MAAAARPQLAPRDEREEGGPAPCPPGMTVVFTTDTADSYIEKETLRLSQEKERQQRVWTATGDRAVQTAAAVHGATVVSSSWLVRELKDSRAEAG
jgi:predicted RNA-binding protein with PIN domain